MQWPVLHHSPHGSSPWLRTESTESVEGEPLSGCLPRLPARQQPIAGRRLPTGARRWYIRVKRVDHIACPRDIEAKLESKHRVTLREARQVLLEEPTAASNQLSAVSKANTLQGMGEFWDTHDFTEFDDQSVPDVEFEAACGVPVELDLFSLVEQQAQLRGVATETLVDLWLQQKLAELPKAGRVPAAAE